MIPETSLFDAGPPPPCPARFNIAAYCLARWARETPGRVALTVAHEAGGAAETWTSAGLERTVLGVAAGLRAAGLAPGDRVALRMGNTPAFPFLFFGTIAAGGIAAPTSAMLTGGELDYVLRDMGARFLACTEDLAPAALPPGTVRLDPEALAAHAPGAYADTGAEDPAFLVYTSGATGRPKGVLHAQRSAWARRMMWQGWYGIREGDLLMHAGAFNWTYTLGAGLTDPWAAGAGTLIWTGPRDPGIWARLAARFGPQIFAAAPGVYRQLLNAVPDLRAPFAALRHGLTAGEAMPAALAARWREATGKDVHEALGMSEVSTYISGAPGRPARPGRAGWPQPGRRVAILPEEGDGTAPVPCGTPGALAVSRRDPGLMLGYWGRPEETARAFRGEWFLTGDRAAMDPDGAIEFLGRGDDVMNALGYRVGPEEVEAAIAAHPGVAEVAAAELPVRPGLSVIAAFIVPRGAMPPEDDLRAHAAGLLAAYKVPKAWIEVPSLPRTATGKITRRALVAAHRRDGNAAPDASP